MTRTSEPFSAVAFLRGLKTVPALIAAFVGAVAFTLVGAPVPALLGSVVTTAIYGSLRRTAIHPMVRNGAMVLLGLQIGSGMSPEAVDRLSHAPVAAMGLAASTVTALAGGYWALRLMGRWTPLDSFLGAVPGALSTVLALTASSGADAARVVFSQSLRLGVMVVVLPLLINAHAAPSAASGGWPPEITLLALAAAGASALGLDRLKVPAGTLLGPILVGAALRLSGVTHAPPHPLLFQAGLLIIGASTGVRIAEALRQPWLHYLPASIASLAVAMLAGVTTAFVIAPFTDLPFMSLMLAFAPGGVEAMVAIAMALNLDPTFVSAAHITRVVGLTLAVPFVFRLLGLSPAPPGADDSSP